MLPVTEKVPPNKVEGPPRVPVEDKSTVRSEPMMALESAPDKVRVPREVEKGGVVVADVQGGFVVQSDDADIDGSGWRPIGGRSVEHHGLVD